MSPTSTPVALVSLKAKTPVPPGIRSEVMAFMEKLSTNPTSSSLHVERINAARDKRVRTARVNDKYRAVLFEVDSAVGKHFLIIGFYHHDEAYRVAPRAQLRLNPVSGMMEVLDSPTSATELSREEIESRAQAIAAQREAERQAKEEESRAAAAAAEKKRTPAEVLLDAGITEETLVTELGISLEAAEAVFRASTEDEATKGNRSALEWENDAVSGLLAGLTLEEVKDDLDLQRPESDPESDEAIVEALQRRANKELFKVAENEKELADIIDEGSFNQWRIYLHPSQRKAVEANYGGSGRLIGGAGTGKTVVLIHRTNRLLKENPTSRMFLTTFTRKLANSLKSQLNLLNGTFNEASQPGMPGLWISGIDATVWRVITNANPVERPQAIAKVLGGEPARDTWGALTGRQEERLWLDALDVVNPESLAREKAHPTFLSQEYKAVVLGQGLSSEKEYLRAKRPGRGTSLNRAERKEVWRAVSVFMRRCLERGQYTYPQLASIAAEILTQRGMPIFDHVLVDEAQDFHPGHWRFLRAATAQGPNDIYLAEDSHQRIYGQQLKLSHYGISTRGRATCRLTVNYRTTAQTLRYASAILDGTEWVNAEGDTDTMNGYRSLRSGPEPILLTSQTPAEEYEKILPYLEQWRDEPEVSIGILCRTNNRCADIANALGEKGIDVSILHDANSAASHPITAMTMHNAKGLEFTHVILLGLGRESLPPSYQLSGLAPAEREDALQRERALLYVAASRARDQLIVSVMGECSELLPA